MSATAPGGGRVAPAAPMTPRPFRVSERRRETHDTWTLALEPADGGPAPEFGPGQFNMLYAFGVGEVPISISGAPGGGGPVEHTVRAVGPVSEAICRAEPGTELGLRGPFGSSWPLAEAAGRHLVIVAGGLGLAPLRGALLAALARREELAGVALLLGGRSPDELLYGAELDAWAADPRLDFGVTVDAAGPGWEGHVGVVTTLIGDADFDPARALAFVVGPELMMRFTAQALLERGLDPADLYLSLERNMKCAVTHCGRCQLGPAFALPRGPGDEHRRGRPLLRGAGAVSAARPRLAVWKFASCDGCQLSLLDLEDELLALAGRIEIAYFLEAGAADAEGPYDLSLVEGSVTTPADAERIQEVRRVSRRLVTIGACATAGGIQALRNFADVEEFAAAVYADPSYISTLATSTPIADHVAVDFELHGCPIDRRQLLEVVAAYLAERRPQVPELQRLRRVQAARQRLRHGRPRHRLPRPGHPRRLRRPLPRPRPRLLRLLRADGVAQRRVAVARAARARRRDAGPGPPLPQLQRRRPSVPRGRRRGRQMNVAEVLLAIRNKALPRRGVEG